MVAVDADRVDLHLQPLPGDRDDLLILDHAQHALRGHGGVVIPHRGSVAQALARRPGSGARARERAARAARGDLQQIWLAARLGEWLAAGHQLTRDHQRSVSGPQPQPRQSLTRERAAIILAKHSAIWPSP